MRKKIKKEYLTIKYEAKDTKQPYRVYDNNDILYFCQTEKEAQVFIDNFNEDKYFNRK